MREIKKCSRCKTRKPVDEFYTNYRTRSLRPLSACKSCYNQNGKKFYRENIISVKLRHANYEKTHRDIRREQRLKKAYGITRAEYASILGRQNGHCATCDSTERLVVDHCHSKKNVRGILCAHCNLALGYVLDNISTLNNLVLYLEKSR